MSTHEEEVLGKAYDARLMRRLLEYLRPYWLQVLIAFGAIVGALMQAVSMFGDMPLGIGTLRRCDSRQSSEKVVRPGGLKPHRRVVLINPRGPQNCQ